MATHFCHGYFIPCRSTLIDEVVLATSDLSKDDDLLPIANEVGIPVFRGSESNVLDRFSRAALVHNADVVVRVCADNPFVDPVEIDRLVNFFFPLPAIIRNHQERLGNQYADGLVRILSNHYYNISLRRLQIYAIEST